MSNFKRFQSKVFWNQMETRDAGNFDFPSPVLLTSPRRDPTIFVAPASPMIPRTDERDRVDGVPESDTSVDQENVTVIHVEMCGSPAVREEPSNEAVAVEDHLLAERSFSPTSRGQRSQDSGFSDSGRSDSSGTSNKSPRRRRKRRSSRRRTHPRIAGLREAENAEDDGPAHTSTPKQETRQGCRLKKPEMKELSRQLDFSDHRNNEEEPVLARSPSIASRETINDFLYTSEPPDYCEQLSSIPEDSYPRLPQSCSRVIPSQGLDVRAPVRCWLEEIRYDEEDEMDILFSKRLPRRKLKDEEAESRDLRLLTASAATAAKKVIDAADSFEKRYQRVFDSIGNSKSNRSERDALRKIEAEASEILLKMGSTMPRRTDQRENPKNLAMQLGRLKNSVDRAFDKRLDFYIEKVVLALEEAPSEAGSAARGALAALTALGLAGPRAGASVARCSGIRALLTSLVSAGRLSSELRSASLRALASVCCCIEAVDQFVREGGPEILGDILAADSTPQSEKSEAAALVVQITAPWMDYVGLPYVEPFAHDLISALTNLAERTSCKQTLLLSTAAINHMAHSRRCIGPIIKCDSIKRLLRCVKKTSSGNVWLMEQVASLVGQVARVPQARAHLAETRASVALVCFLRMQPPGLEAESYRRLEATATEALTRLCVDPEIAKQVVAVGGSDCLPSSECSGQACVGDNTRRAEAASNHKFHSTKSLRVARKIAAEQIDMARMWDSSPR
ncbi:hypothetical protein TSAR_012629 [Trichomalopsis sarcophagae]|uniref:Protein inscuteable homologue C-terminal domain-containing protein n=1 Tax=Trichomalopsis sarcophagae TaxID=543379 RepID=A0A232F3S6_9HYME|nr:hypothetical protein TSAR_012629 [Trichomalopsis sarcophagae]